jgi:hypothetical protein
MYHVCLLIYNSMIHSTHYIHGTDMSVHIYGRWPGFQMYMQNYDIIDDHQILY